MRSVRVSACVVLIAAVAVACGSTAAPRVIDTLGSVSMPDPLLAPRTIPSGWFVSSAWTYAGNSPAAQSLYGWSAEEFDAARDDGILVVVGQEDGDLPEPAPDAVKVPKLGPPPASEDGNLAHFGAYTVLGWYSVTESPTFVIGRGYSDAEIIRAARAAVFPGQGEGAPTIPKRALPAGLRRIATAPALPRETKGARERIDLRSADGRRSVRILVSDLDFAARRVDDFLADLPAFRAHEPSVERQVGATTVLVRGDAPRSVIEALAGSVVPQDRAAWKAFQRRVLDLPARALFPTCGNLDRDTVVIDGVHADLRWAVALPTTTGPAEAPCVGTAHVEVGQVDDPSGSAAPGIPAPSPGDKGSFGGVTVLTGEDTSSGAAGDEHLVLIGGSAPAGTTRVVVRDITGPTTEAKLADGGSDRSRRYWGAYFLGLRGHYGTASVSAYAGDGRELGRWVRLGPGGI